MDKQLHLNPPTPGDTGKVVVNYLTENRTSSFLFQPKELVQFETAWNWQSSWREDLLRDPFMSQAIWLLEHHSCYTLGRGGDRENILFDTSNSSLDFHRIDRGGDITHHIPGQLVIYLVIDLRRYKTDLHWYLRQLEGVLIDTLKVLDLPGERMQGFTGVWCEGYKVASIGVGCRRWVTQHGMALNISCELEGFNKVLPCGLDSSTVGKLEQWIPGITVEEVCPIIKKSLSDRFTLDWMN